MNVKDAAYAIAHDYPGGVPALATRMGVSRNVLQNKLNPAVEYHKLTLDEAMRLQALTGDPRILHAMAEELGYVCVSLPGNSGGSDMELLDSFLTVLKDLGEFSAEFQDDWSDGKIKEDELSRLRAKFYALQSAGVVLMNRVEELAEKNDSRA